MFKSFCFRVFLVVVVITGVSFAYGPSWSRTDAGTTWQQWTFDNSDVDGFDIVPEAFGNSYGTPMVDITVSGGSSGAAGWYASWLGRTGVWHGDLTCLTFSIPNTPIANEYKEIWAVVGFRGLLVGSGVVVDGAQVTSLGSEVVDDPIGDGWKILTIGWRVEPNPSQETITLAFADSGADVDYATVDTICVPEPATMCLLALGGLALMKKK